MSHMDDLPSRGHRPQYPPGFRARRGLNWGFLGLLYTSYYMCRYNLSIANKAISDEFGFSKGDMGFIITTALLAYACGQIINGLLTDKMGGKRAMLIGAAGTVTMNVLFGLASKLAVHLPNGMWMAKLTFFHTDIFVRLLSLFVAIRGIDGYMQAYGAPGMVKINTAWFNRMERGRFAGIFGFMINLGRFGIFTLGPALLAGFVFLGMWRIPPLHWRWLFYVPAGICAVVAVAMALTVAETPEQVGFHRGQKSDPEQDRDVHAPLMVVFKTIALNPVVWLVALAYACTGAVRQGVDQWFPRYMQEVHHMDLKSRQFQFLGFLIPFVASVGSLLSGYLSDTVFRGRRAPVAGVLYFTETLIILLAAQFHSANAAIVFFVLISLTANATHSILGTAAGMDIGGRKMAGFASGCIDSFQYFGGSLAGLVLGSLLDVSWGYYFYFMAPFGFFGMLLMTARTVGIEKEVAGIIPAEVEIERVGAAASEAATARAAAAATRETTRR
jgi:MFS transporter, OPA family, glycerol-3-phosphate transporter